MQKRVLEGLEPNRVFYHFENICMIPHGSGNEEKLCDYCEEFARAHSLSSIRDKANNLIIFKAGTKGYENHPAIIIQGHLDMVCAKRDGAEIDMQKDPLKLKTYGEYLGAEDTSLGGDDGIAVAYCLALLESDDIPHPPLEIVLTTDEEVGMTGAFALDTSPLTAKMMLNIDSENEGVFTVGCAGGLRINTRVAIERESVTRCVAKITVGGLLGGHSGVEINCGRANSNIVLGKLLKAIGDQCEISLISLSGGEKDNVITSLSSAEIACNTKDLEKISSLVKAFEKSFKSEFGEVEKGAFFILQNKGEMTVSATKKSDSDNILSYISSLPFGVYRMSEEIKGLVETSNNFGVLLLEESSLRADFSVRSSKMRERDLLAEKICDIAKSHGAKCEIKAPYPAWEYKAESHLREVMVESYKRLTGETPEIEIIHAGLECGLFSERIEGLDAVSIGPNMKEIHSFNERLEISSVERTWKFIKEVLKNL